VRGGMASFRIRRVLFVALPIIALVAVLLWRPWEKDTRVDAFFTKVTGGGAFTCALTDGGEVYCWGASEYLGTGYEGRSATTPQAVDLPVTIVNLASSWDHTCALGAEGSVYCWGDNHFNQVSPSENRRHRVPVKIGLHGPANELYVGPGTSCAALEDGLRCWGTNGYKTLSDDRGRTLKEPTRVLEDSNYRDVKLGGDYFCFIDSDGAVHCRGVRNYGWLGDGISDQSVTDPGTWVDVELPAPAEAFYASRAPCVWLESEEGICWGGTTEDDYLRGVVQEPLLPRSISLASPLDAPATTWNGPMDDTGLDACSIKQGRALCQAGDPASTAAPSTQTDSELTSMVLSSNSGCATTKQGELYCWHTGSKVPPPDFERDTPRAQPILLGKPSGRT